MEAVKDVANAMSDMTVDERLTVRRRRCGEWAHASEGDQRVTEAEIRAYIERGALKHVNSAVTGLVLLVDGEKRGYSLRSGTGAVRSHPSHHGVSRGNDGSLERCENLRGIRPRQARRLRDDRAFACVNGCYAAL